MKLLWATVCVLGALAAGGCASAPAATPTPTRSAAPKEASVKLTLTSSAFRDGETIPTRYTCDGAGVRPPLSWSGAPVILAAFALIVDDPDAPSGDFTHWVVFNIPPDYTGLPEGVPAQERLEQGMIQGRNDAGKIGYQGPCPPPGNPHHYRFTLYALHSGLSLKPGSSKQEVLDAMKDHILSQVQLTGTYGRGGG